MHNILVEPLLANDVDSIAELTPNGWNNIVPTHKFYTGNDFCYPHKICQNGTIIGIGTAISFGTSAWLAHIIVSEEHRNKGYGGTITEYLVKLLTEKYNCKTISLIATEMGYPVYSKLGFREVIDYLQYESDTFYDNDPISPNIEYLKELHIDSVIDLDERLTGENRRKVISQYFNDGYIYLVGKEVVGYYLPHLGEGHILSENEEAGIELLKLRLRTAKSVVIPAENSICRKFLQGLGYKESVKGKRMAYGIELPCKLKNMYSRIGGYLG